MEKYSRIIGLRDKVYKAKEIGMFYLARYLEWPRTPQLDKSFFYRIKGDKSIIKRLLLQDIESSNVLQDADRICSDELRIYDTDPTVFKKGINWHKDYYSGFVWPIKPFNRIYYQSYSGADLNVPWELSRFQFILPLIQAFEMTSNSKYLIQLTNLIDDWIDKNPYCFGVNWWTPMEVAIRAVNLVLVIGFFADHISKKKLNTYLKVLWKHALYIYKYEVLNDGVKNKNNHYLASMLGLLAVSLCFKGKEAKMFRDYALRALKSEILRQFMQDGGNFESATGYHQFSLEVVLVAKLFLLVHHNNKLSNDLVNTEFESGIHERLLKALELVWDYMSCYRESPQIGDSSDCRVILFKDYFNRQPFDHSFLFKLGKITFNFEPPSNKGFIAKIYPESGYACYKNNLYGLIAFAGPKGTDGGGGHGHNDKCSFVMQVNGAPILVDSGTYIYNARIHERFELKGGKAHNTVMIDNEEQCEITPETVFGLLSEINSQIKMKKDDSLIKIQMEHDGYRRLNELGTVFREIACQARGIEINDSVNGSGFHNIKVFFNLHPSATGKIFNNTIHITSGKVLIRLSLPEYFHIQLEDSWYSDSYQVKKRNSRIVANANLSLSTSWKTKIEIL